MTNEWRWIVDLPRSGSQSMEMDETLLHWVEKSPQAETILRFYQWREPTVSLGKHQKAEESAQLVYCRLHAIPIVRRPTGGRAVFHADELTYALISNDTHHFPLESISGTYLKIARALRKGLEHLGIAVELAGRSREPAMGRPAPSQEPCFVSPSRYELVSHGCKITGSAQRRLKRSFLQHGSIPLEIDYEVMAAALGAAEHCLRGTAISVSQAAGREVSFSNLCEALHTGFEEVFRVKLRLLSGVAFHQRGMLVS